MKEVEFRVLAELMSDSRRSDRELAKIIGVSQPTVTRTRLKLEKEGYIKEYTVIPDFSKIGYSMCAFTFAKFETTKDLDAMRKAIKRYGERLSEIPQAVLIERGLGSNADGLVVSFHQTYSEFTKFQSWLRQFSPISTYELNTFIIDLKDEVHIRYLTFKTLAKHMLSIHSETK
jgi:DNA-binding Lrp family transcriptional regulator